MKQHFTKWQLTPTEHAIITDVLDGHTTLEAIAAHRGRSRRTIQTHLVRIYRKMRLKRGDMTMMVLMYLRETGAINAPTRRNHKTA